MKIYLFRPHKEFAYCGGMVVVVANSYERAIELAIAHPEFEDETVGSGEYELEFMTEAQEAEVEHGTEKWVYFAGYSLQGEHKEEAFVNYNYA